MKNKQDDMTLQEELEAMQEAEESAETTRTEKKRRALESIGGWVMRNGTLSRFVLLVLAILIGFGIKTVAAQRITMGFQDYSVQGQKVYDLNEAAKRAAAQAASEQTVPNAGIPSGGSCGI